jgi:toxin ParE1/3/4
MRGTVHKVEWRQIARENLLSIIHYIRKDSPIRSESFGKELREKVTQLGAHPSLGRSGRPGMPTGTRELVVHSNYIVVYRVLPGTRTVEILRIRHTAQLI